MYRPTWAMPPFWSIQISRHMYRITEIWVARIQSCNSYLVRSCLFNFCKPTHDYVSLIAWAQQAATIYSIYISTAARGWNVFLYLKKHFYYCIPCFSASTFELTDAVCYISLSIFVNAVLHMLTEWLPLPTYNVCTLLASTRPPLNSCHMCKCCRNRPLLELIPSSATGCASIL